MDLRVFIGYDSREPVAAHVLAHSIQRRASGPVSVSWVALTQLTGAYTRERAAGESTEFSLSRFLVPYLSWYTGYSLFVDCDMLCLVDLAELWALVKRDPQKAVWVVPHDYTPRTGTKFLGHVQLPYPRKNWSSLMVFNTAKCRALSLKYVTSASAADLHRLAWVPDEQIGHLPLEWNWLVHEYAPNPQAKILHYTLGGPWFDGAHEDEFAWKAWQEEYVAAMHPMEVRFA